MKNKAYGKYSFEISNTDKVFFPESKYTKGDLIEYYEKISETMLPYLKDRMVTMVRFPNGIQGVKFYQKETPEYFPKWIDKKLIQNREEGTTNYVICNKKATLVYLANQACITPHIWLSRKDKPEKPDKLIIDLDPEVDDFSKVKTIALKTRNLFEKTLELPTYVMTSGSRGLHVVVPLKRTRNFDKVREFAQLVANHLEKENPELVTTAARKNKREGKIYLDVGRNAFGQTAVAPYAVRPIEGAPVATPLEWDELNESSLNSQSWNIKTIFNRLKKNGDPWEEMQKKAVVLTSAEKIMYRLIN